MIDIKVLRNEGYIEGYTIEEKDGFNLCFYINHFESDLLNWNETSKRIDWNIKENKYKESKRNYARDRFNNLK